MTTTEATTPSGSPPTVPDESVRDALDAAIATVQAGEQRWADRASPTGSPCWAGCTLPSRRRRSSGWPRPSAPRTSSPTRPSSARSGSLGPMHPLGRVGAAALAVRDRAGQEPGRESAFRHGPRGRVVVPVLPSNAYQYLLLNGFTAEVWMQPGVRTDVLVDTDWRRSPPTGTRAVGLVLGAGNIATSRRSTFSTSSSPRAAWSCSSSTRSRVRSLPVYTPPSPSSSPLAS